MSALSIEPTYPTFTDSDGSPLDDGYVWIGTAGSATPIASPQTAYWDAGLTQVVTQPVRTRGGYPLNAGAIGRLYVAGDYSILVRNRNGYDLYSATNATERISSELVTFLQAGSGAVTRTAQSKMRDVVNVNDYGGDLAYAVTSWGATAARLVVSSPVSISSDLTIPSNISLRVEGAGIITVASGKRLYINGPFSCDRLHRAFNAPLISVSITADINANALNISTVSANLVEAGQVVTGTGVALGTMIGADYGVTGVGQVALNMFNGVLSSRAMTLTGASVIFAKGTVDQVYPQWWGAVADGTTDCTAAITHAIYSIRWGGKVKIPAGKYRVTSGAVLHGGLIVEGDGAGDTNTGAPPTAETQAPTYIFVDADNTNIFTIPPKADHVIVRDMSLGTALTTGLSPVGTGRKGIVFNGHAPQFLFMPKIENCYLFQFQIGVLINDDWAEVGDGYAPTGYYWTNQIVNATAIVQGNAYQIATVGTTNWAAITGAVLSGTLGTVGCRFLPNATAPTGTGTAYLMPTYYDWGVNPGAIEDCEFRSNTYGVYFNTTNADAWRIVGCDFLMPANSSGVYLRRCGYLRMETCFGYAAGAAASEFVNAVGAGDVALDTVTLDSCQAEYCSHFLNYSAASTTIISVIFNVFNCIHQLNADVYLGRMCQYNSYNTQIQSYIYVQATGVRVSSINDWYQFTNYSSGPTWHISVVSGDANTIFTYIPGRYPTSTLTGPIINGVALFGGAAAGSPVGVVTPAVTGQEYLDVVAGKWYKSTGLSSADWVALN